MAEDKKSEATKPTAQEFAERYAKLCEEMGFRIVVTPVWVGTNHGSFEMTLQYNVGQLPQTQLSEK